MIVNCPSCKKKMNVDREMLPAGKVTIKCPACQNKIVIEGKPATPDTTPPAKGQSSAVKPPDMDSPEWKVLKRQVTREVLLQMGLEPPSDLMGMDNGSDDSLKALVCEDEAMFQQIISETLTNLGYKVELKADTAKAIKAIQTNRYNLVSVDHRFPDDEEGGFKILQEISALPPEVRRKMYVAYISADLATMDTNSAFILGANLTVSKNDIKSLGKIFTQGMKEHDKLYSVFTKVEEEIQKHQQ